MTNKFYRRLVEALKNCSEDTQQEVLEELEKL
jgi:hypothetical protein